MLARRGSGQRYVIFSARVILPEERTQAKMFRVVVCIAGYSQMNRVKDRDEGTGRVRVATIAKIMYIALE